MSQSPQPRAWLALFAVYLFWGTTYVAIRMALESFPPMMLVSLRFLCSGLLLLAGIWWSGVPFPRGRELWLTALFGVIALGGGNGLVVIGELWIPSGMAALFISATPFWMLAIEALLPGGDKVKMSTLVGILVGFVGVLILIAPALTGGAESAGLIQGFVVFQLSALCWCTGSILQRRMKAPSLAIVSGTVQQLATGLFYLPLAFLVPEHPVHITPRGIAAVCWLVVFGSVVGYSSYVYAMQKLPVAIVSTHTYVNPIVAVFLGWLIYREPFGVREFLAMATIFAGVALVKYFTGRQRTPESVRAAA